MLLPIACALGGWILALTAVGLLAGLPGLHMLPRATPRLLAALPAAGAAACWWTAEPGWIVAAVAPAGVLATAALACCVRRNPDRGYLPPAPRGVAAVALDGHADADALYLEPPAGPPRSVVVLAHGGGNDRLFGLWRIIDELRGAGHAVLTGHLAGHGRGGSDRFDREAGSARLDALVAAARARAAGAPVVLLGQSVGASLCLDAVARGQAPDGVVSVSAAADGLDLGAGSARELLGLGRPAIYRALAHGNPYEVLPAAGGFKRRAFPVRVDGGELYTRVFDRTIRQLDLLDRLAGAPPCPTLLIHGTLDGVIGAGHARRLAAALGDRADLLQLAGGTHMDPLFDRRAIRRILGWIDGLG